MPDDRPPSPGEDALRALEDRLSRASAAAEQLIAEATANVRESVRQPPPNGWESSQRGSEQSDLDLLVELVGRLRDLVPPDLQRRLSEALRELLLALRALIDWYLERVERRRATPVEVTDIPIL